MVEAERDLDKAEKRKLTTYVPESELKQACLVFEQKFVEMRVNEAALMKKRCPQKIAPQNQMNARTPGNRGVDRTVVITAVVAAGGK